MSDGASGGESDIPKFVRSVRLHQHVRDATVKDGTLQVVFKNNVTGSDMAEFEDDTVLDGGILGCEGEERICVQYDDWETSNSDWFHDQ